MAKYRQVHVSFWQDTFVLDLTPEEKYFYLYLMTNSKTSACGIYELPKKVIELETGYNRETVDKLLGRFIEYGKVKYSESTKEIYLPNWIKFNEPRGELTAKCVVTELNAVKCRVFAESYLHDANQSGYPLQGATKGLASPLQGADEVKTSPYQVMDKDKEKEKEKETNTRAPSALGAFDRFWSAYPKKKSKGDAEKAWRKLNPNEQLQDRILHALEQAKTSGDWQKDGGQFIPHPATWLNAKGWEDDFGPLKRERGVVV